MLALDPLFSFGGVPSVLKRSLSLLASSTSRLFGGAGDDAGGAAFNPLSLSWLGSMRSLDLINSPTPVQEIATGVTVAHPVPLVPPPAQQAALFAPQGTPALELQPSLEDGPVVALPRGTPASGHARGRHPSGRRPGRPPKSKEGQTRVPWPNLWLVVVGRMSASVSEGPCEGPRASWVWLGRGGVKQAPTFTPPTRRLLLPRLPRRRAPTA